MIRRGFGARSVLRSESVRIAGLERVIAIEQALPKQVEELRALGGVSPGRRIIIVGAGMAGLCAAYELQHCGFSVTVLEADERHAGGRVRTLRVEDGRYAELGAMRIPQDHELTRFYCKEMGLTLRRFVQVNDDAFLRVRGHKVRMKYASDVRQLFDLAVDERPLTDNELWYRAVGAIAEQLSRPEQEDLYSHNPTFLGSDQLDEDSLHARFLKAGLSDEAIQLLASTWNLETSAHFAFCEHLREELEGVWTEEFFEIEGGMDHLPAALASKLASPVSFGSPVVDIDQHTEGVTAKIEGSDRVFEADWMICTAPLGVLSRINYRPGWSAKKMDALRRVNYDDATKVLALTSRRFWEIEDGIFGGGSVSDGILGSTWYPGDNAISHSEEVSRAPSIFLASYSWGQTARRMARSSPHETVVSELANLHASLASHPEQIQGLETWAWGDHPWSVGAYSFYHPGDFTQLHQALVAPEGRVLLAGEHASIHHSWIQGGIESALHAARSILEFELRP